MNIIIVSLIIYSIIATVVSIIFCKKMIYWKKIGVRGLLGGYGSFVQSSQLPDLKKEALSLELGYNLIKLVDKENNNVLLQRIKETRNNTSIPKIRIIDNMQLDKNEFKLSSFGEVLDSGIVTEDVAADKIIQSIQNHGKNII